MTRAGDKLYRDPDPRPPAKRSGNIVLGFALAMAFYFIGMQIYYLVEPWL